MSEVQSKALEYYDCIMTCEIAVRMAQLHGEYPNRILRDCIKQMLLRIEHKEVKLIFKGIKKANYPLGALAKVRREFDEALG